MDFFKKNASGIITLLFFLLGLLGILNHEMWRDEYQAWLIAVNSNNWTELLANIRLEGHPLLWYAILFIIHQFSGGLFVMKAVHLFFATATVFLLNRFGPFKVWVSMLISFSYFFFYEYAIISRSYVLALFFAVLFCVLYTRQTKKIFWMALAVAGMALSSLYGLVLSVAFGFYFLIDFLYVDWQNYLAGKKRWLPVVVALMIVLLAYALALIQIYPEADNGFPVSTPDGFDPERIKIAMATLLGAYMPVPVLDQMAFWNTNILWGPHPETSQHLNLYVVFALMILGCFSYYFRRHLAVLSFYLVGTLLFLGVYYYTAMIFYRYTGFLFIILICAFWLFLAESSGTGKKKEHKKKRTGWIFNLFIIILGTQLFAGLWAYGTDIKKPFSNIMQAGEFIRSEGLQDEFFYGSMDYIISPLSFYAGKAIFMPESDTLRSFMVWDHDKKWNIGIQQVLAGAVEQVRQKDSLIMILHKPLRNPKNNRLASKGRLAKDVRFDLINQFDQKHIAVVENFYFYDLHRVEK